VVVVVLQPQSQAQTETKGENNESYDEAKEYRQPMSISSACGQDRLLGSHEGYDGSGKRRQL
jgi:hypothetical protein